MIGSTKKKTDSHLLFFITIFSQWLHTYLCSSGVVGPNNST